MPEITLHAINAVSRNCCPGNVQAIGLVSEDVPVLAMFSESLGDIALADSYNRGIRTAVPDQIYAAQVGKMGMRKIQIRKREVGAVLLRDPLNIHGLRGLIDKKQLSC